MHHIMARFWWILALRGFLGILLGGADIYWIIQLNRPAGDLFGMSLFFRPAAIVATLILFIGIYALLDGLFAFLLGVQDYGDGRRWGALITEGCVSMALGLAVWLWSSATLVLLYGIAAWSAVTGILEIMQAMDLNEYKERRGPFFLAGLCSILFGLGVAFFHSGATLVWLMGTYAFLFGIPLLVLAFRLRAFAVSRHNP